MNNCRCGLTAGCELCNPAMHGRVIVTQSEIKVQPMPDDRAEELLRQAAVLLRQWPVKDSSYRYCAARRCHREIMEYLR